MIFIYLTIDFPFSFHVVSFVEPLNLIKATKSVFKCIFKNLFYNISFG